MGLQFVQIGVVRQVAGKVLVSAEGIQIQEHRIVLRVAGVGHLQMVGVGVHAHHLPADIVGAVRQIDAVAEGFAHFGLAVGAGQAEAGFVIRQQRRRLHQRFAVEGIEAADDLPGLLQHGQLVLAHRHRVGHEGGNIRRLADGIGQKPHGDAVLEAPHLDLRFDGGVALQPGQRHQIHIVKGQLRQFADVGLHQNGGFLRVDAAGQIVQRHLQDVVPHLLGMVEVVRQRLGVGDHEEQLFIPAAVLQRHAVAQRAYIVAHMKPSGGTVACQNDLSHCRIPFCMSII